MAKLLSWASKIKKEAHKRPSFPPIIFFFPFVINHLTLKINVALSNIAKQKSLTKRKLSSLLFLQVFLPGFPRFWPTVDAVHRLWIYVHLYTHCPSHTDLDGLDPKDVLNHFNVFWLSIETIKLKSIYKVSLQLHQVFMKTCAL